MFFLLFILFLHLCFSFFFCYFFNSLFNKASGTFSNFFNDIRFKWNFLYLYFLNISITFWLFFIIIVFCIFFSLFNCNHLSLNDYGLFFFDSWKFILFIRIFYVIVFLSLLYRFLIWFYLNFDSFLSFLVSNSF